VPGHRPAALAGQGRARAGAAAAAGPAVPAAGAAGPRLSPSAWPGWSLRAASRGRWLGVPGCCTAPAGSPGTGSCGTPGAATPRWRPLPLGSSTARRWRRRGRRPRTWGDGREMGGITGGGSPRRPGSSHGDGDAHAQTVSSSRASSPPSCRCRRALWAMLSPRVMRQPAKPL